MKRDFNINSILVEPGLTLIPAFLSQTHLVDMVVITTGSTIIGPAGRTPHWTEVQSTQPLLQHIDATLVGKDVVTILEPIKQA